MKKPRGKLATGLTLLAVIIYAVFFLNNDAVEPGSSAEGALTVTYIDIGQGDSELIQQGKNTILIDTGEYSQRDKLIGKLSELNVSTLDYVIATHPHADHIGSMNVVIDTYDIKHVMMPNAIAGTVSFEKMLESISRKNLRIERPVPGESITAGNIELEILAPNAEEYKDANNYSIVARLMWGRTSFLFTGDAEALSEKETLAKGFNPSANVLKVGHHGSASSTSDDFLNAVNPDIAVISCEEGNTYGHPHKESLEKLRKKNITVYRTDTMGTITISSDGDNITVAAEKTDQEVVE
ncbi:MAG: MBL fold metallo-hydrolase [Clostridiales bacterium]|jgi:competence protein ComEC|nr:MBL fold metallo-hydrolase [Clostridiales bacterium]